MTFVGIAGVRPAKDVAKSFELVVEADQHRVTTLFSADRERIKVLAQVAGSVARAEEILTAIEAYHVLRDAGADPQGVAAQRLKVASLIASAGGEAAQLIANGRAKRWDKSIGMRTRVLRDAGRAALYNASPAAFRIQRYLQAITTASAKSRVVITTFDNLEITYDETASDADLIGEGDFVDDAQQPNQAAP